MKLQNANKNHKDPTFMRVQLIKPTYPKEDIAWCLEEVLNYYGISNQMHSSDGTLVIEISNLNTGEK